MNSEGNCEKGCLAFDNNDYSVMLQVCPGTSDLLQGCSTGYGSGESSSIMNCSTNTVIKNLEDAANQGPFGWGCDATPVLTPCGPDLISGMCV